MWLWLNCTLLFFSGTTHFVNFPVQNNHLHLLVPQTFQQLTQNATRRNFNYKEQLSRSNQGSKTITIINIMRRSRWYCYYEPSSGSAFFALGVHIDNKVTFKWVNILYPTIRISSRKFIRQAKTTSHSSSTPFTFTLTRIRFQTRHYLC